MPKVRLPIPDTTQSITRPIIIDIVNQVQEITNIPKSTKIFFPGDIQKMQTAGSNIGSDQDRFPIFNTDRYTFIDIVEDHDYDSLASTNTNNRSSEPVFLDDKLDVVITPLYSKNKVTINFKHRCPSKTEALKWRDDVRLHVSQMRDMNLHDITYHYLLSNFILILLTEIYNKRENYLPYGQTVTDYITDNSTERLTLLGDLVGKDVRLAISETQKRIIGLYDFEGLPEKPEREDDNGTWTISFAYKFEYDKVFACHARYPIIVHNQLLDSKFTDFIDNARNLNKEQLNFRGSYQYLRNFEADHILNAINTPEPFIRIPAFDDYKMVSVSTGTGTVLIALAEVDITDSITLFNLKELGDVVIDKDILNFIRLSEHPYACNLYKSILNMSLYKNNNLCSNNTLICDSNLNIKATQTLDLRNQYRVRFSIVTDITLLNKEAIDRLRKYPLAFVKIIAAINELLKRHPDFNNLGDMKYITNDYFSAVYRILTGYDYSNNNAGRSKGFYDTGIGNNWPYRGRSNLSLFGDLDSSKVKSYLNNKINFNTVQVTGIVTVKSL